MTSSADSGPGTLRAAIALANAGDTISYSPRLDGQTIRLTSGELAISQSLTIKGPGALLLDVDAGGTSRVFDVTSASATVTISGLTLSGGNAEDGGGILDQGGALTLAGLTLAKDQAVGVNPGDTAQGGAVLVTSSGALTVTSSGFVHDLALGAAGADGGSDFTNGTGGDGDGGAIYADVGTSLTVTGSTFTGNQAIGGTGGSGGAGVRKRLRRQQQRLGHRHTGRRLFRYQQHLHGRPESRSCRQPGTEHPGVHRKRLRRQRQWHDQYRIIHGPSALHVQ